MLPLRIIAMPTSVVHMVRTTMRSPGYGHPAHVDIATGYGPCRHCLQYFEQGQDRRILFTYDPFHGLASLPQPGPVFVHEVPCPRYDERAGFPAHLLAHPLTIAAYGTGRALRAEHHAAKSIEKMISELLERSDVEYLHLRDTNAGCYDFRIERGA